jgi:hypothetical protein
MLLHGVTDRFAVDVWPLLAEIVIEVKVVTCVVVTVKLALVVPAATATVVGTVAIEGRELESVTSVPPEGAGPVSVTVPVDGAGPLTVVGFRVRELSMGAKTYKFTVKVVPDVAESVE